MRYLTLRTDVPPQAIPSKYQYALPCKLYSVKPATPLYEYIRTAIPGIAIRFYPIGRTLYNALTFVLQN